MHLKKCHPEEGLENLNIFCRICEPDVLRLDCQSLIFKSENKKNMLKKHIFRAVNNYDDEEELVHHMQEKHEEVLKRIKGPQQFLN